MKFIKFTKRLYLLISLLITGFNLASQTVTLYTPNGSTVQAFYQDEMQSSYITYYTDLYRNTYPQAEVLANASTTYNCHSYAWNLAEGGNTVCWLNQNPDLHKYWDDYSYIETTEGSAEKIFYYSGDHSAIKSTVQGKYDSKWGAMPLMRHSPEYGPTIYQMTYKRYYKKIPACNISGDPYVCPNSVVAYTLINPPTNYLWNCSSNLTPVSGVSGSFTTSSTRGNAWVAITVNGIEVTRKNIVIGSEVTGIDEISTAEINRYYASPSCSDSRFNIWTLTWQGMDYSVDQPIVVFGKNYVDVVSTTNNSNYTIASLTLEQGNYSYTKYITVHGVDLGLRGIKLPNPLPFSLSLSPNPAAESTTISLTEEVVNDKSVRVNKEATETEFQLWNSYGKIKTYKTKSNELQISLSGLTSGIYYVIAIKDNNIYRKQLIVY